MRTIVPNPKAIRSFSSEAAFEACSPRQPVTVAHDALVLLRATASDAEDGDLRASITWTSDISGPVGQGSPLSVTLPPGSLTASVTDSEGLVASRTSALVTVSPPPDPCAAAPDDIDRDSVCDALDRCYGYDDMRDADADGTPDACDGLLTVGFAQTCANVADFYGQANPPAGVSFTQVTAGQVHTRRHRSHAGRLFRPSRLRPRTVRWHRVLGRSNRPRRQQLRPRRAALKCRQVRLALRKE